MKRTMRILLIFILLLFCLEEVAGAELRSLTSVIQELSAQYKTTISFNHRQTDTLFVRYTPSNLPLSELLAALLVNTPMVLKSVDNKYYYLVHKSIQRATLPSPEIAQKREVRESPSRLKASALQPLDQKRVDLSLPSLLPIWVTPPPPVNTHRWAVKSNMLYLCAQVVNIGVEWAIAPQMSFELVGNYSNWGIATRNERSHRAIQPQLKYWIKQPFDQLFFGAHIHWADFDMSNSKQGKAYLGSGFSCGYQFKLTQRWHLEMEIGAGYAWGFFNDGNVAASNQPNFYVGLTKVAANLVYILK